MKRFALGVALAIVCACGPLLGLDDYEKADCVRNCDASVTPEVVRTDANDTGNDARDASDEFTATADGGPGPTWGNWPMPHAGDSGAPNPISYTVASGVIKDNVTNLEWQESAGPAADTRDKAAAYCQALALGPASAHKWRLPSRIELVSLLDATGKVDPRFVPGTGSEPHWSSSVRFKSGSVQVEGWSVNLEDGRVLLTGGSRVRCVRGAVRTINPYRFFAPTDAIIIDDRTRLKWERRPPFKTGTLAEAQQRCALLTVDSESGWRLPTTKELLTLVDENGHKEFDGTAFEDRHIFQNAFGPTPEGGFRVQGGLCVDFKDGQTVGCPAAVGLYSRCVKVL
jgi:hypothetical protein